MMPVLGSREMRRADAAAIRSGIASASLMENAATALVEEALSAFPEWTHVVVVCGPGNNGGDGLAASRLLRDAGVEVSVFTLSDPEEYRGDPAAELRRMRDRGIPITALSDRGGFERFSEELETADGAIDALFGTGLSRALTGRPRRAIDRLNAARLPVVSADLPSGLSADSGSPPGACVCAAITVTFAAPKLCHVLPPARASCGRVVVRDIGISREILERAKTRLRLVEKRDVREALPPRPSDSHKGDFGRVAIVAGSAGKAGAAVLAASGALRAGAGLVTVFAIPSVAAAVVASLPEAMTEALPERDGALAEGAAAAFAALTRDFDAIVAGPGLTTAAGVRTMLLRLIGGRQPLVLDADALNAFPGRPEVLARRRAPTVLTPHPGEAGRLLGISTGDVQADRLAAASRLARASRAVVVLKGEGTLIADRTGEMFVNPTGTPLLATAGSGDVLAGSIGALLGGGLPSVTAAWAAAYLHGRAGEILQSRLGDAGLLAHELADALPRARRELRAER